jgi:predicted 3-demethylubiquinone-9 3-methyltransferase (glyoxalase superfamily)
MHKIIPCLWFDDNAEEAVKFYTSIFHRSKVGDIAHYVKATEEVSGKKAGSVLTVKFQLEGQDLMALNGGPQFKFNQAISFFVSCKTAEEVDALFKKLAVGGKTLMALGTFPFSKRYGWVEDKYGVSWQLNVGDRKQKIAPCLMFAGKQKGRAKEAMELYTSLFKGSRITMAVNYEPGDDDDVKYLKHAEFTLNGQEFMAMDSSMPGLPDFSLAISLLVNCRTQREIDELWAKLTANGGKESVCGWLYDKFGVSWQITPIVLDEMTRDKDTAKVERVMAAMLKMVKLDIKTLELAYKNTH